MSEIAYEPNDKFDFFLEQLRKQSPREWGWLIKKFRARLLPWLRNKARNVHPKDIQSRQQFVEEVFEETILKFYEIFPTGSFRNYGDLEATIVTISGYKLMEGYTRLKKERQYFLMDIADLNSIREQHSKSNSAGTEESLTMIAIVKKQVGLMEVEDQELLMDFFNGMELQDIAERLDISPAACRKRKQRALDKLKQMVSVALRG